MTTQEVVVTVALIRAVLTEGIDEGRPGEPLPPAGPTPQRPRPDTGIPVPEPRTPEEPQPIRREPVEKPEIPPEVPRPIGDPPPEVPGPTGPGRNNPPIEARRYN